MSRELQFLIVIVVLLAGVLPAREARAAALQFVRKISGYRVPSAANRPMFDEAVDEVMAATTRLLGGLQTRSR